MNYDGLKNWQHLSLADLRDYWIRAGSDLVPLPWQRPPQLGMHEAEALLVLTSQYRMYELSTYREFYRIMIRDGAPKLVFSGGVEEPIIEAYVLQRPLGAGSFHTVKQLFTRTMPNAGPNVLPFVKKSKK